MDCDFWVASRRTKARRIGIATAMIVTAGSAVPKIFKSIVVAFDIVRSNFGIRSRDMDGDLQLLSEMSSREMIFRNEMMPELEHENYQSAGGNKRKDSTGESSLWDIQHAHAHGDQRANLLLFVDRNLPNDLPWEDGKYNIECTRVS